MTAKDQTVALLDKLPENSSLEDIQYHLYVLDKVQNGLSQVDSGKTFSHEQAQSKLNKWLT
jgi:predicted transcriptional regulator